MEVIRLAGYTEEEKLIIARRHLVPRHVEENGLSVQRIEFSDNALKAIIGDYTREAGLRSFDRTMPEEINRIITDAIADILWTPSPDADQNLANEGVAPEKVQQVGNIMIDSLEMMREKIERQAACTDLDLAPQRFGLVTLHRPSNVDDAGKLKPLCRSLIDISKHTPLAFPIHPRTRKNAARLGILA